MIGEAYSGALQQTFAPEPEPEAHALSEAPLLRVDTSISPAPDEAPGRSPTSRNPSSRSSRQPEAAPEPEPEPVPCARSPSPRPRSPRSPRSSRHLCQSSRRPRTRRPANQPEPEPEPEPAPTPEPEPEPELEPVATFERPSEPQVFEQSAPRLRGVRPAPEPAAPLVTEPIAPEALPATNGQLPHDFEDDLLPPDETAPVEEAPALAAPEAPASANGAGFRVSISPHERRAGHGLRMQRHRRGEGLCQGADEAARHLLAPTTGRSSTGALPQARHDRPRRRRRRTAKP